MIEINFILIIMGIFLDNVLGFYFCFIACFPLEGGHVLFYLLFCFGFGLGIFKTVSYSEALAILELTM